MGWRCAQMDREAQMGSSTPGKRGGKGRNPAVPREQAPRSAQELFPERLLARWAPGCPHDAAAADTAGRAQIRSRLPPAPWSWQGCPGVLLPRAGLGTPWSWGTLEAAPV